MYFLIVEFVDQGQILIEWKHFIYEMGASQNKLIIQLVVNERREEQSTRRERKGNRYTNRGYLNFPGAVRIIKFGRFHVIWYGIVQNDMGERGTYEELLRFLKFYKIAQGTDVVFPYVRLPIVTRPFMS